jgi:hypothetical protein
MSEVYVAQHRPAIQVVPGPDRTILVGAGRRIRVDRHDSLFAAAVVADLAEIEDLPNGPEMLQHGDARGAPIMIRKPELKPEPQNGWVFPDPASGGAVIVYDPSDWPQKPSRALPSSPEVLLTLLRHANDYVAERGVGRPAAQAVS